MKEISIEEFHKRYKDEFFRLVEFFKKYDISYSLAFGSMIGAVREHDIIIWDPDIDLFLLHEDILKLREHKNELPEGFYFKSYLDYEENFGISRVYIKGLCRDDGPSHEIRDAYFDLYHTFYVENDPELLLKVGKNIKRNVKKYWIKSSMAKPNIIKRTVRAVVRLFCPDIKKHIAYCTKEFSKLKPGKGKIVTMWFTRIIKPMPFSDKLIEVPFGDKTCTVYDNYDEILTGIYGDYMTPHDEGQATGLKFYIEE